MSDFNDKIIGGLVAVGTAIYRLAFWEKETEG